MAEKKPYEPPPLGMLGMKLGGYAPTAQSVGSGGVKLQPLKPHSAVSGFPKSGKVSHTSPSKTPDLPTPIRVYAFEDPTTGKPDATLATLKVSKVKTTAEEFADRLKSLGLGLAVGHPKIITGGAMHIAIVPKDELKAAAVKNPGVFATAKPAEAPVKWTSAGCVVLDSLNDHEHVYVIKPANNYGPWTLPKGQVDKGESVKDAAIREVKEETGLHVSILPGKGSYLGKMEGSYSFTHFFLAVKVGGSPHPTEETEKVLLTTWDEARRLFQRSGNSRDPRVLDLARQALKQYR